MADPNQERTRACKQKRAQFKTDKKLGGCLLGSLDCVGWLMVNQPGNLQKGDTLCPDCSQAHTALLRRNEGAPTQRGNWR